MGFFFKLETKRFRKSLQEYVRVSKKDYKTAANNKLRDALYWAGNLTKQADRNAIKRLVTNKGFLKRAAKIAGKKYPNRKRNDKYSKKTGKVSRKGFSSLHKKIVEQEIKRRLRSVTYNKSAFIKAAKQFPSGAGNAPKTKTNNFKSSFAKSYLANDAKPFAKAIMFWKTQNGKKPIERNALQGLKRGFAYVRKDMERYIANKLKKAAKSEFK